ncbi:MAG: hypothetical protein VX692_07990 [Chloroflexota bacterium]|nr:hypothetical protein [Chloroflexota bacterium]
MRLFGLITVALVAMAVIAITPVLSQNMNEPTVTKGQSGMGEGIKVHGDWEVKVTDPETGVEELYAFRNAFIKESGSATLVAALTGSKIREIQDGDDIYTYDSQQWLIRGQGEGTNKCDSEPTTANGDLLNWFGNPTSLKLSGVCEVPNNMLQMKKVNTFATFVNSGQSFLRLFTSHELETPVKVAPGQLIAFTVSISFN